MFWIIGFGLFGLAFSAVMLIFDIKDDTFSWGFVPLYLINIIAGVICGYSIAITLPYSHTLISCGLWACAN